MGEGGPLSYEEWVRTVPAAITGDPLWTVKAYRLALFVADLGWQDVTKLVRDRRITHYALRIFFKEVSLAHRRMYQTYARLRSQNVGGRGGQRLLG